MLYFHFSDICGQPAVDPVLPVGGGGGLAVQLHRGGRQRNATESSARPAAASSAVVSVCRVFTAVLQRTVCHLRYLWGKGKGKDTYT